MKTDSIWKDNKTLPELDRIFILERYDDFETGIFNSDSLSAGGVNGYDFYDKENIKKWCYLDDLIEISIKVERLEKELQESKNTIHKLLENIDFEEG